MAAIHAVLWRCVENRQLPVTVQLQASCRRCGCAVDVLFRLTDMQLKPARMRCPLCSRRDDMKLLGAKALA
jgi:hypothetical protein